MNLLNIVTRYFHPEIKETKAAVNFQRSLIQDIQKAQLEWQTAAEKLNWVCDNDEIDYAIYAFEAAQRKYEMLLRRGKSLNLHLLEAGDQ